MRTCVEALVVVVSTKLSGDVLWRDTSGVCDSSAYSGRHKLLPTAVSKTIDLVESVKCNWFSGPSAVRCSYKLPRPIGLHSAMGPTFMADAVSRCDCLTLDT